MSDSDASSDEMSEGSHESWAGFNSSASKDEAETDDEVGGDDAKVETAEGNSANRTYHFMFRAYFFDD